MRKFKIAIIIIVSLLTLIVSLQNTQAVETKLLFVTITMPRVLLLILTFITGFVVGIITASYVLRKPRKSEAKAGK
jgi:uncharacterized integral membrane protein